MTIQKLFLTFFGTGLSPKYPEIISIVTALLMGVALLQTMGLETLAMLTLALSIIAIFEINKYDNSSEIVVDKAVGIWFVLLVAYPTAISLSYPYALELAILFSFGSFWLFDSWKPSTIGWIRNNVKGGLGMIGSSVLAGFAGGFLTITLLWGVEQLLGSGQ